MTVVKSVSDVLRDCESETELNLNRPLRISPGPRHLSRPGVLQSNRVLTFYWLSSKGSIIIESSSNQIECSPFIGCLQRGA